MFTKVILIIACLLLTILSNAQEGVEEKIRELNDFHVIEAEPGFYTNLSQISQIGESNTIIAIQESSGDQLNSILSTQLQQDNSGYIKQVGAHHTSILYQNGSDNEANLWSLGERTFSEAYQYGNGNDINAYVDNQGILPKAFLLQQIGDNNSMDVALLGNGDRWYKRLPKVLDVNQFGNDNNLELVLEQSIFPGIKVTQNGGMNLSVKQSDFYFPMK